MSDYLVLLFFVVPIWCVMLYWNKIYHNMRTKTNLEVLWIIIKSALLTILVFSAIVFLFKFKFVSRIFSILFIAISSSFILLEKIAIFTIMHAVHKRGYNTRKLFIVGTGERARKVVNMIKAHAEWGLRIAGVLDYEKELVGQEMEGYTISGTLESLQQILQENAVDEVVFIVPRSKLDKIENSVYICETQGIKATVAVDLFDVKIAKSRISELEGIPFVSFETTLVTEWGHFIKRAFDITVSLAGIILTSPLLLLTAILVKLTSPGRVFYMQKRVGLNGRKFILYKFRTMYKGSHEKLSELKALNVMRGPVFKMKNDPRVTPVGRFLRRFSIDELPQLFNILLGHMSVVGPRPLPVYEVAEFKPWQRRRLSIRPGLTCLWQISGRNTLTFEEWMALDLEYIDSWSLWLDFKIFIRTIKAVLFGKGAY